MNKTKQILSQYYDYSVDEEVLKNIVDRSIVSINSLVERKNKVKTRFILTSWYVSTAGVLASLLWLYIDLKNSGSLIMIKLLLSSFSLVVSNWQDYLLSLTDLIPLYSVLVTILSVATFVMLNKIKSNVKSIKLNHFVI